LRELRRLREVHIIAAVAMTSVKPEIDRLARDLRALLGEDAITVTGLAAAILEGSDGARLANAIEEAVGRVAATDELDESLWGPRPTDAEIARARRIGRAAELAALEVALADALSREEAAVRLGISPQAVSKRLAAGALVALSRGRTRWFPAWQFHEDGVLPGLADVIAAYQGTSLALTVWATTPSADLGGLTPAKALTRRGGTARVVTAAHALVAAM
jgi:hypothetical protein